MLSQLTGHDYLRTLADASDLLNQIFNLRGSSTIKHSGTSFRRLPEKTTIRDVAVVKSDVLLRYLITLFENLSASEADIIY